MSDFAEAVDLILRYEGGDVDDPRDPGGLTHYGISKRAYPNLDIRNLSVEQAKSIYFADFWLRCSCDKLPYALALPLFDAAVNCGVYRAATFLQAALDVLADGKIGPKTLAAAERLDGEGVERVLLEMTALRCRHYALLDDIDDFYARGWYRRTLTTFRAALSSKER